MRELNRGYGLLWWLFDGGLPAHRIDAVRMQRQPGPDGNPGSAYRREVVPVLKQLVER